MKGNKILRIIAGIIFLVLVLQLVFSLSFTQNPSINNGQDTYTANNLVCQWTASADANSTVNVTWYLNDVQQFEFSVEDTSHTLNSPNTSKGQTWICQVNIWNETDYLSQNASMEILNSLPSNFKLFNLSGYEMDNRITIFEDVVYNFIFNATDNDGDTIEYSNNNNLCDVDTNTGEVECTPTNSDLLAPYQPRDIRVTFFADDGGSGTGETLIINFTIIPVNDQAQFVQTVSYSSAIAGIKYELFINGSDEELDYPLNFTMSSTLNNVFPGAIIISNYSSTVANITFSNLIGAPVNDYAGNWTVNVNVTDNSSWNSSRPPDQMTFTLEIFSTNYDPNFTSDFNVSEGNQGEYFESYIFANDSNVDDTLSFSVLNPTAPNQTCTINFPWSIETIESNATNASARIVANLNNSHVVCRYVNITVEDQFGGTKSSVFFFNITNINDEPDVYDYGINGNISNQSAYLFQQFFYLINASDIDALTYDSENTGILYYYLNDTSIFNVSSSGIISGMATELLQVGNYSILVNITDNFVTKNLTFNISILGNSPPVLNILNSYFLIQNNTNNISFTSNDSDNHSMFISFNSLTNFSDSNYSFYSINNESVNGELVTTWILNISRSNSKLANALVGNHLVQINITDELNGTSASVSTGILNITINNSNDAPFFDLYGLQEPNDAFVFNPYVNRVYETTINSFDYDFLVPAGFAEENLSFSIVSYSPDITIFNFTKISNYSAYLSFVGSSINSSYIVLAVFDNYGANATKNVTFLVKETTLPPSFNMIKPFFNSTTNQTVFDYANSSLFSNNRVSINLSENTTVVFDALAVNDSHVDGNNMSYRWFIKNVLNYTVSNANPGINTNFTHEFNFFSNGTYNVTLEVVDYHNSRANWTWKLNVSNVNRPPFLVGPIDNLTGNNAINGTLTLLNFFRPELTKGFDDLDIDIDYNLTYSVVNPEACSFITFTVQGENLRVAPSSTGFCNVRFLATDTYGETALSNNITIEVIGSTETEQTTTTSTSSSSRPTIVTVPFEEEVEVPSPIKLIAPGQVETYVNRTLKIPITIKNTWPEVIRGVTLSGISLNASFIGDENVSLVFEQVYFPSIPFNGEFTTTLTVSNYRTQGPFEIIVYAHVNDPEFTDSVSILINSMEQSSAGDEVKSKVTFAKDMISENPECRELNELIIRAEQEIENLNYREALNLVNAVINGCKYLISKNEQVRNESPSLIEKSVDFVSDNAQNIVLIAGLITLVVILIYMISGIKKMIQEKK